MSKAVYDRLVDMLGAEDPADLRLNIPLAKDKELARFPRTGFIIAGMDMFRDDGLLFAEKLRQLGYVSCAPQFSAFARVVWPANMFVQGAEESAHVPGYAALVPEVRRVAVKQAL
jgi:acetyl esterase/lipase